MNDLGTFPEPGCVRMQRILPGPIERVWAYLTESELRGTWLASGEMELISGGTANLYMQHKRITTDAPPEKYQDVHDTGIGWTEKVLACEAPNLLTITWSEETGPPSEVTFELTPSGSEHVLLVVTHRLVGKPESLADYASGWHAHLDVLTKRLAGRPSEGFWSSWTGLRENYASLISGS